MGICRNQKSCRGVRLRQIRTSDGVYTLRPSFAFSYMTGTVDELEKPLFLMALHVPIWAVTFVFGRNDKYFWYSYGLAENVE